AIGVLDADVMKPESLRAAEVKVDVAKDAVGKEAATSVDVAAPGGRGKIPSIVDEVSFEEMPQGAKAAGKTAPPPVPGKGSAKPPPPPGAGKTASADAAKDGAPKKEPPKKDKEAAPAKDKDAHKDEAKVALSDAALAAAEAEASKDAPAEAEAAAPPEA